MLQPRYCQYLHTPSFLEISSHHIVMVDMDNKQYRITAANVKVGDILSGQQVKSIHPVVRCGIYSPLTQSGEMRVDGMLTSNYVDLIELPNLILLDAHSLVHIIFWPQRLFCHSFIGTCRNEIYINGYGPWTYLIVGVSSFIQPYPTMFDISWHSQVMVIIILLLLFLTSLMLVGVERRLGSYFFDEEESMI
jgi:Hint module